MRRPSTRMQQALRIARWLVLPFIFIAPNWLFPVIMFVTVGIVVAEVYLARKRPRQPQSVPFDPYALPEPIHPR